MSYEDQTAVRLLRCIVNDGTSTYCPPIRREVLRRLLKLLEVEIRANLDAACVPGARMPGPGST